MLKKNHQLDPKGTSKIFKFTVLKNTFIFNYSENQAECNTANSWCRFQITSLLYLSYGRGLKIIVSGSEKVGERWNQFKITSVTKFSDSFAPLEVTNWYLHSFPAMKCISSDVFYDNEEGGICWKKVIFLKLMARK